MMTVQGGRGKGFWGMATSGVDDFASVQRKHSRPACPAPGHGASRRGKEASRPLYPDRPAVVWRVYFGTWEGKGSRASRTEFPARPRRA